jgi:hypothetical protein
MKKGWFCVSLEFGSKSLHHWMLRERKNLNVQFFVLCVCVVVVGLYENVKKNKVCQEIPVFFLSFYFRSRFLFPCPEEIL